MTNVHYYYGRASAFAPRLLRRMLPDVEIVRGAEATIALRRALDRIARTVAPIDLVELPEETVGPTLLRGLPPYAVRLHSSRADWRYAYGETLSGIDRRDVRLKAALLRGARLVTAPSAAMADHAASFYGYPRSRIAVISNPLDAGHFAGLTEAEEVEEATAKQDQPSVLYVGRLDPYKGLDILMQAAEVILSANPAATIDIVGEETAHVHSAGLLAPVPPALRPRIWLHGRVPYDELPAYYRRATVCVVPSRWESWGYTVAEAMAYGTPVVGSRVGGIAESIADGQTGLLVPPGEPAVLAGAVNTLLADPARRAAMGRAARRRAAERFASDGVAARMLDAYRSALGVRYDEHGVMEACDSTRLDVCHNHTSA